MNATGEAIPGTGRTALQADMARRFPFVVAQLPEKEAGPPQGMELACPLAGAESECHRRGVGAPTPLSTACCCPVSCLPHACTPCCGLPIAAVTPLQRDTGSHSVVVTVPEGFHKAA